MKRSPKTSCSCFQAYSETISLVEAIEGLQNYKHLLEPPNIRYYYAFALNRRNNKGDREKALSIIKDVSEALILHVLPSNGCLGIVIF